MAYAPPLLEKKDCVCNLVTPLAQKGPFDKKL
jgi:hypothetical protein